MATPQRYRGYTLAEAQEELALLIRAKKAAIVGGKSYNEGSRGRTFNSLAEIQAEIDRISGIVDVLTSGRRGPLLVQARIDYGSRGGGRR